jgi:hypothetical protein
MTRIGRRGRMGAATGAALVLLAIPLAACQPSDPSHCPTRGTNQVRVAVVVDARALGASTTVVCVVVPTGSTGATALRARADRLGTPYPRYNSDGLLCAIDGRPAAPQCGKLGPNGYEYWSYWLGGSSWHYATVGPAGRTVSDQSVDGWRFIAGGSNVPPNRSSSFADLTS